jgi:hypothetical protein
VGTSLLHLLLSLRGGPPFSSSLSLTAGGHGGRGASSAPRPHGAAELLAGGAADLLAGEHGGPFPGGVGERGRPTPPSSPPSAPPSPRSFRAGCPRSAAASAAPPRSARWTRPERRPSLICRWRGSETAANRAEAPRHFGR